MGEPSNSSVRKEDSVTKLRENVEAWRYKRYEKLSNRLSRGKENSGRDNSFICPSILGIPCPSKLRSTQDPIRKKPLMDVKFNSGPSKTDKCNAPKRRTQMASLPRQTITSTSRADLYNPFHLKKDYFSGDASCSENNRKSETSRKNDLVFFSTPSDKINRLEFSDCISEVKSQKPKVANIDLQKCLKYD